MPTAKDPTTHFLVVPALVACLSRPQVTFVQGESKDVLSSVTLRVFDTEKAVAFYSKLGARFPLLRVLSFACLLLQQYFYRSP
jgi:hypothetical protein